MLNPNMEELAQIDNETLEVILKTDRNDETSPTSRMSNVVYCYLYTSVQCFISITFWVNEPEKLHTLKMLDSDNVLGNVLMWSFNSIKLCYLAASVSVINDIKISESKCVGMASMLGGACLIYKTSCFSNLQMCWYEDFWEICPPKPKPEVCSKMELVEKLWTLLPVLLFCSWLVQRWLVVDGSHDWLVPRSQCLLAVS